MRNQVTTNHHFIAIQLEGRTCNRDAIGARVEVDLGERTRTGLVRTDSSYQTAGDHRVHLGLGPLDVVPEVRVTWPDGSTTIRNDVEANAIIRFDHPGSR